LKPSLYHVAEGFTQKAGVWGDGKCIIFMQSILPSNKLPSNNSSKAFLEFRELISILIC